MWKAIKDRENLVPEGTIAVGRETRKMKFLSKNIIEFVEMLPSNNSLETVS